MAETVLTEVFGALNTAVLERRETGRFVWLSAIPTWWGRVWGGDEEESELELATRFPFVGNFLIDAEEFWKKGSRGRLDSGVWYEEDRGGGEALLEASAVCAGHHRVLLIELREREENGLQELIQKGRDNQLQFLRDLARHEKAEDFLNQMQAHLEMEVEERTWELQETNESLQQEVKQRQKVEGQLRASLSEKETLLREIHHRVKNNLQIISSLLDLQASHLDDEAIGKLFAESRNRVRSMGLIHDKLYQYEELNRIDLRSYIESLIGELYIVYGVVSGRIGVKIDAEAVELDLETAIPCGLILNELISNCLKHAFPQERNGEIEIGLHASDAGEVRIWVRDDGVGMPPEVDFATAQSLGLTLVRHLTRQLRGEVAAAIEDGTRFDITFLDAKSRQEKG